MKYDIAPNVNKVFGIGLSRTGTTSLAKALEILGFSCMHYPQSIGELEMCRASVDTPVANGYKFLDFMYPRSKFILTTRDKESWLRSCAEYWRRNLRIQSASMMRLHLSLYGSYEFNANRFEQAYRHHLMDVEEYFSGREAYGCSTDSEFKDFLCFDIVNPPPFVVSSPWERLCSFLGVPIPDVPFPHLNSQSYE